MTDLITEARELCEKATPGPWKTIDRGNSVPSHGVTTVPYDSDRQINICSGISPKTENAVFIARSRTLIPELCDALEKAQAQVPRWISSTERLPEIGVPVLVRQKYSPRECGEVTIGRWYQPYDKRRRPYWKFIAYCCDEIVYSDHTDFICPGRDFVTHWMPLPEMPKGE